MSTEKRKRSDEAERPGRLLEHFYALSKALVESGEVAPGDRLDALKRIAGSAEYDFGNLHALYVGRVQREADAEARGMLVAARKEARAATLLGEYNYYEKVPGPFQPALDERALQRKWAPILNSPHGGSDFAARFMLPVPLESTPDYFVVEAKLLKTTRPGRRQDDHNDVSRRVATQHGVWVLLQNLCAEPFSIWIAGEEVWVKDAIRFPATTIHAGSGREHARRLYVLYTRHRLAPEALAEVRASVEDLHYN